MKLAVMQPYFFPYLGYWRLVNAADLFVLFDDVAYIKKGFVDRNTILISGQPRSIKLEVKKASQNRKINEIELGTNLPKLQKTIHHAYKKAPQFQKFMPVLESIFQKDSIFLADFLERSILNLITFMGMDTPIIRSSQIKTESTGREKIFALVEHFGAKTYINMEGGRNLYSAEEFADFGARLRFVSQPTASYAQKSDVFVPNLSIIDVLMNLEPRAVLQMCVDG